MGASWKNLRKVLGWCPNAETFAMDEPPGTWDVPENISKDRDTGARWFIIPALVLLLPLLPALMFTGYTLMIPFILPSTELQMAVKLLIVAIPVSILILYGRHTHDGIGSTLSGALMFPVFELYTQVLGFLSDPGFMSVFPAQWPGWNLFAGIMPFVLLLGAIGFLASRKTTVSLLLASALGFLAAAIVLGIR